MEPEHLAYITNVPLDVQYILFPCSCFS